MKQFQENKRLKQKDKSLTFNLTLAVVQYLSKKELLIHNPAEF